MLELAGKQEADGNEVVRRTVAAGSRLRSLDQAVHGFNIAITQTVFKAL
jgi:hypothetical protein